MGVLNNAALLGNDPVWRSWVVAAAAYTARQVLGESESTPDHAARVALATRVLKNPTYVEERLSWILATDPALASAGSTATAVGESAVIAGVAAVWTQLSKVMESFE